MTTPQRSNIETRKIPENNLEDYFAKFSKHFLMRDSTNRVNVEVLSEDLGDQVEANGTPVFGITYDPKGKTLEFELEGGDHRILDPREVWVEEELDGFVRVIEVVRQDGRREVAKVIRGAVVQKSGAQISATENVEQEKAR